MPNEDDAAAKKLDAALAHSNTAYAGLVQALERMLHQQTQPWPDGVLGRYLTVGGAVVDVECGMNEGDVTITCRGCGYDQGWAAFAREGDIFERHTANGRAFAQKHAETCRAMPRP